MPVISLSSVVMDCVCMCGVCVCVCMFVCTCSTCYHVLCPRSLSSFVCHVLCAGLGAILREPQVLAPVIIAAVVVAVLVVLCGLGCLVRRRSRKKERGLYEVTNFSEKKPIHQLSADGPDSFQVANTAFSPDGTIGRGANQPSPAQLNGPGGLRVHPTGPSGTGEWSLTSITPDSGIPSLPVWDEMQLGPAARYNPPQGSLMDNSNESEQPVQWTLGPAHESRDTPPIVDRAVSVDHTVS